MPIWTSPYTWTDGEYPNAAQFNQQIKNNLQYLYENATSHFGKFRTYINWVSGDGFTESVGGGSVAYQGSTVLISTSAAAETVYTRSTGTLGAAFVETGKIINCEFIFNNCSSVSAQTVIMVLTTATTVPTAIATEKHIGFKIVNADLSATSGDGAASEATDTAIDITTAAVLKRFRMVFTPGTSCLFYVDDILKATHSTNLPAAADDLYLAIMETSTAAAIKTLTAGRVLIERMY